MTVENQTRGAASNGDSRTRKLLIGPIVVLLLVTLGACAAGVATAPPAPPEASPSASPAEATVAPSEGGEEPTDGPAAAPPASPGADVAPCDLLAPHELTELTGAAFGPGEPTGDGCVWTTETPGGFALTITLDTSTDPPTVDVLTDDPAIDGDSVAVALVLLASERQASGVAAPTPFAGPGGDSGGLIDACELFTPEEIGALLDLQVKLYGSITPPDCGWQSDDPTRILPTAVVSFEDGDLEDVLQTWPDAVAIERAGLAGYEYGYGAGSTAEAAYLTLDLGDGLVTVHAISDQPDIDAMEVVRTMADRILAEAGYTAD